MTGRFSGSCQGMFSPGKVGPKKPLGQPDYPLVVNS